MSISIIFFASMFILYNYFVFSFSDVMLKKRDINRLFRIPLWGSNIAIAAALSRFLLMTDLVAYLIAFLLIYINLLIFYRESLLTIFFFASAFTIHLICVRAISISIISLVLAIPIYTVVHTGTLAISSIIIIFIILNLLIFIAKKIVPTSVVKNIIQHRTLLLSIAIWLTAFNIYLLFNTDVYNQLSTDPNTNSNQISTSLAILSGLYLMLFLVAKVSSLAQYEKKARELELVVLDDKLYRDSLASGAMLSYEVNLTKNQIIKGFEISEANYSDIFISYAQKEIFSDDIRIFLQQSAIAYLLLQYYNGKKEAISEYRYLLPCGEYAWVKAITSFMHDTITGDIKTITFVRDINEEKKHSIELQYKAERDSLTGIYNKGMTEKLIIEHLLNNPHLKKGALFIIDIDNFKAINDNFGHLLGDELLCNLSQKLSDLFRNDDIVGRIGGDEFIVFMKNASNQEIIQSKSKEIGKAFSITYTTNNDKQYKISGSIGIALFPENGNTFKELYKNADIALYDAKSKGKNIYIFYHADILLKSYISNRA